MMVSVLQDLRQLARAIGRAKVPTAVLVLSLALGTGANAAVYGVLNSLLLQAPAGIVEPSRLANIYTSGFSGTPDGPSSYADYVSVKSDARSLASIAAIDDNAIQNVQIGEWSRSARIAAVSGEFFAILQMQAYAGRMPAWADTLTDSSTAVISFALSEQLGGSAESLGKTVAIAGAHYSIVGVTPPRFRGLRVGRECDVWIRMEAPDDARGNRRLSVVARLAPGFGVNDAAEELHRISDDLAVRFPETNRGSASDPFVARRITAVRYSQLESAASARLFVLGVIISGAALLLLSSACLNVASIQVSRGVSRRRELAVKIALGATRARLIRQLLTESICVSLMGVALGLLCAMWTAGALPALFMVEEAALLDTNLDSRTIALTVGVTCVVGALFVVAPAFNSTAAPAALVLRTDPGAISDQPHGRRLRALLVGAQVTLSTILLLGTGLLVISLTRALEGDGDAALKNVAFVSLELPGRYSQPSRGIARRNTLLEVSRSIDGFQAVGWASHLPLERGNKRQFRIEANTPDVLDSVELDTNIVSSDYFSAMGLRLVEGRVFDGSETFRSPAVVVDETLARRYFGQTAVGRHIVNDQGVREEIVGVVRSGRYRTLQGPLQPTVYYPLAHDYLPRGHLVVRTVGEPAVMLPTMLSVVKEAAAGAHISKASTLTAHLSEALMLDRLTTALVGVCGLIGLALASIGVYGVVSDTVQRLTREIGLRVALGASRARIVSLVAREAAYTTSAGLATGAIVALAIGFAARSVIEDLPSFNPVAFASVSAALMLAMCIAAVAPLRHALAIQPNVALRDE